MALGETIRYLPLAEVYVDSKQRQKVVAQLVRLTSNPEVSSIARRILCPPSAEENAGEIPKEEKGGRRLHFVGIALAFASWWYTLVFTEPNFLFGSALLFGAAFFFLLAAWESESMERRGKIISGMVALLLFCATDYGWYHQRLTVSRAAILKSQIDERDKVRRLLTAQMEYDMGDNPIHSVFAYENGSDSEIVVDQIGAIIKTISFGDKVTFGENHLAVNSNKSPLGAEGDGQSYPFLESFFSDGPIKPLDRDGKPLPLSCADIVMEIEYHLNSQPAIKQIKQFRFATRPMKYGVKWFKVSLMPWTDDHCTDPLFQKKNLN